MNHLKIRIWRFAKTCLLKLLGNRIFLTFGQQGETAAARYLLRNGYRILARNWRCRFGEVDIIAVKHGTLALIEVKSRSAGIKEIFDPLEAVCLEKQRRIGKIAAAYLLQKAATIDETSFCTVRFDVIAVIRHSTGLYRRYEINHYEGAFRQM